jgi:hypothetical protein
LIVWLFKKSNLTFSINLATGKELREDIIHIKASAGKLSTELKGKPDVKLNNNKST